MRARFAVVPVCAVLSLCAAVGCQSQGHDPGLQAEQHTSIGGLAPDLLQLHQEALDIAWERVVAFFPDAERPQVETVRFIEMDEWAQVQSECLQVRGFPVEALPDGGMSAGSVAPEQQEALHLAMYECEAQYPLDPSFRAPLTDDEIDRLFDYLTGELSDCLASHGHPVSEPPSREAFGAGIRAGSLTWSPYEAVAAETYTAWMDLNEACPQQPPGLRGQD